MPPAVLDRTIIMHMIWSSESWTLLECSLRAALLTHLYVWGFVFYSHVENIYMTASFLSGLVLIKLVLSHHSLLECMCQARRNVHVSLITYNTCLHTDTNTCYNVYLRINLNGHFNIVPVNIIFLLLRKCCKPPKPSKKIVT